MPYSQLTWLAAAPVGQEESYRQLHYSKNNFCPRRSGHGSGVGHKRVEHVLLLEFTVPAPVDVEQFSQVCGKARTLSVSAVTVNFPRPGHWKWNVSQPGRIELITPQFIIGCISIKRIYPFFPTCPIAISLREWIGLVRWTEAEISTWDIYA